MSERDQDKISQVYDRLIKALVLDDSHAADLVRRGFNDKQIAMLEYKTLPARRQHLTELCADKFNLAGVPGFWQNANGKWQMAGKAGMIVPCRAADGSISALKIRIADRDSVGKYIHLSSNPKKDKDGKAKYPGGTAAQVSVHHPLVGHTILPGETLRITEGELKADIATVISGTYTISLPGINMWEWAFDAVAKLKPGKILLAFDADKGKEVSSSTSPDAKPFAVAKALASLFTGLKEKGFDVAIEDWDESAGKGIDDVLAAGLSDHVREMSNDQATEFVANALRDEMPLNWIFIIGTKRFVDFDSLHELDKEQFSDKYAADYKTGKAHEKVLRHPGFPKVDLPIYEPGDAPVIEKGKMRYFNLWRPCPLEAQEGSLAPFHEHCEYMLPDESERNILYDFMAYNIQFPGKKIHWALLLQGVQGTGKSYFASVMRHCLGNKNVASPSNEAIHEPFTGWQKACQLVVIEELMARGRLELMNKLKPMITQDIAVIREMYRPPYEQPNRFNLLLFTNHEDAIIIDETDRRYCVLYSKAQPKEPAYYGNLWNWTKDNAGRILYWLQRRDLSEFKPYAHAPMTAGKEQLISDSMPPLLQWIKDGIETRTWPFRCDLVASNHLIENLPKHLKGSHPNAVSRELKKAGALPLKQVRLTDGTFARLLTVRRHEIWQSADKDNNKIITEYENNRHPDQPGGDPNLDDEMAF